MAEERLLTVRDVSLILGISEKEVMDLAQEGKIPAYRVGGLYLRFKKEQIEEFRKSLNARQNKVNSIQKSPATVVSSQKGGFKDRISDFLYFNDFYLLSFLIILFILLVIFRI